MAKTGRNLADLMDSNRSEILGYVLRHEGCTRADLSNITGLTPASITKILHSLIDADIVHESVIHPSRRGRRSIGLSFNYGKYKLLAVKLAWTSVDMQVYDFGGSPCDRMVSTPLTKLDVSNIFQILDLIGNRVREMQKKFPEIIAVGVAVPGPYSSEHGGLMLPPYNLVPSRRSYIAILSELEKRVNLPIFVGHDSDMGALAYSWFMDPDGEYPVIMNILGNYGLGVGIVSKGKVYTSSLDSSSELAHITIDYKGRLCPTCGGRGCISAYCSEQAIGQIAQETLADHPDSMLTRMHPLTAESVFICAARGDIHSQNIVFNTGVNLGYGIISLLHVFNPNLIVISGNIVHAGNLLLDGLNDSLRKNRTYYMSIPPIKMLPVEEHLTLLGGVVAALRGVLKAPTRYLNLPENN